MDPPPKKDRSGGGEEGEKGCSWWE